MTNEKYPTFWAKVRKTKSCWLYVPAIGRGYPKIIINGVQYRGHRLSYEQYKGKIPKGLVIDHLCRVRWCINPDHLEAVTHKENILRGIGVAAKNVKKTHCIHGHPLFGKNLYAYYDKKRDSHSRLCRACKRGSKNRLKALRRLGKL